MIETKIICDRCRKECEGTTYYTIDIYGHNIGCGIAMVSMDAAEMNTKTNLAKAFGRQRHICSKCIKSINEFIHN